MSGKSSAELRVFCYTKAAIPQPKPPLFSFNDEPPQLVKRGTGESAGAFDSDPSNPFEVPDEWGVQPEFSPTDSHSRAIDPTLEVVTLGADVQEGAGSSGTGAQYFVLKPRTIYLNNTSVTDDPLTAPVGDSIFNSLSWRGMLGPPEHRAVSQYLPDSHIHSPRLTFITNPVPAPDRVLRWETIEPTPENQSFVLTVIHEGVAAHQSAEKKPAIRFIFPGDRYSIVERAGAPPALEEQRVKLTPDGSGGFTASVAWFNLVTLHRSPTFPYSGAVVVEKFRVRRIAGQMVIDHRSGAGGRQTYAFQPTEPIPGLLDANDKPRYQAVPATWPEGTFAVQTFGVLAKVNISYLNYMDYAVDVLNVDGFIIPIPVPVPRQGTFSRLLKVGHEATSATPYPAYAAGYRTTGAQVTALANYSGTHVSYDCTLQSDSGFRDTPCVSRVMGHANDATPLPDEPGLDIRPAVLEGWLKTSEPNVTTMGEVTFDIDRTILEKLDPTGAHTLLDCPITLEARYRYDDGSYDPWEPMFYGYIYSDPKRTEGFGQREMQLIARDPVMRLQGNNCRVTGDLFPAALLLYAMTPGAPLYDVAIIKFLLGIALGNLEAAKFNGNGNAGRYVPVDHLPLLNSGADPYGLLPGVVPTDLGEMVKKLIFPPYGEDLIHWISDVCGFGTVDFFYGKPVGYSGFPVPVCGLWWEYLKGRPTHTIPDCKYNAGDENAIMQAVDIARRPERMFNAVAAWENPGGEDKTGGAIPAAIQAMASLPDSDPNAAIHSWRKLLILRDTGAWTPAAAAALASRLIQLFTGKAISWPTISFRGVQTVQVGNTIIPKMEAEIGGGGYNESDAGLKLDGKEQRILSASHHWNFRADAKLDYETSVTCFEVNADGK